MIRLQGCHYRLLIPSLLAMAALVLFLIPMANIALANPGLKVSGALVNIDVTPGTTYYHIMTISSVSADPPMDILVDVVGLGQAKDGAFQPLGEDEDTGPYSARELITEIDKPSFHLEPGGSEEVKATIAIPENLSAGTRYAIIYIHNQPDDKGPIAFASAVVVPVVITIPGSPIQTSGDITDITVKEAVPGEPLEVVTTFQNTGNYHFKASNTVTVYDESGQAIATASAPLTANSIIPLFSYEFNISVEPGLLEGTYQMISEVVANGGTMLNSETKSFHVAKDSEGDLTQSDDSDTSIAKDSEVNLTQSDDGDTSGIASGASGASLPIAAAIIGGVLVTGLVIVFLMHRRWRLIKKERTIEQANH